jgi:AcrR family transcriptional regulator
VATTLRGKRTRARILQVAADAFAERGYADAALEDLVAAAEVTKGAFYFHYESKESLAHAVVEAAHRQLEDCRAGLEVTEPDPMRRIVRLVFSTAATYRTDPVARGTTRLLEESNQLRTSLRRLSVSWIDWLTVTLEEAAGRGQLVPGSNPADLAEMINASVYGVQQLSYTRTGWTDLQARTCTLLYHLLPSFVATPQLGDDLRAFVLSGPGGDFGEA